MLNPARERLTAAEARALTERIRQMAERVWALLLEAYQGRAWEALGYPSWRAYATAEFGMSQSRAYQLLHQARVELALREAAGSTEVTVTEAQARAIPPSTLPQAAEAVRLRVVSEPETPPQEVVDEVADLHLRARMSAPPPLRELLDIYKPRRVARAPWVAQVTQGLRAMPPVDTLEPRLPRDLTFAVPLPAASKWLRALATEGRRRLAEERER